MPYIYKITNTINGKCYVGKTIHSIEKRWNEHCRDARKESNEKRPLYSAIRKYGIEYFTIEQLEECSITDLSDREVYWIETLGSFKYGYNATTGGDGKPYIDRQLVVKLYEKYRKSNVVSELMNISHCSVLQVLKEQNVNVRYFSANRCYVVMVDKDNDKPIKQFSSYAEAARWLIENEKSNCKEAGLRSHIADACNGKRKTVANFRWYKVA